MNEVSKGSYAEVSRLGDASEAAVGIRVAAVRKVNGLTQGDFASSLGTTGNVVGNWERGESSPRHPSVAKICSIYGVSADFLILGYLNRFTLEERDRYIPALQEVARTLTAGNLAKRYREELKEQLELGKTPPGPSRSH